MNLYVDIGNTNIKFGYEYENSFKFYTIPTKKDYSIDTLNWTLSNYIQDKNFDYVIISSVVPTLDLLIKNFVIKILKSKIMFLNDIKKHYLNLNNRESYTIGSDIKANALYISLRYENAIVISLGTASVIFKVENKTLQGVIIAPGLKNSYLNLISSAKKLSEVILKLPNNLLGNNTSEAISIGIIKGHLHMINGFIKELDPNNNSKIILTGGDAEFIKNLTSFEYVENLVILGLKDYYEISK